jgi:hypothetical protein
VLSADMAKATTPSAIKEAVNEMRVMRAATGSAPAALSPMNYYMASDSGWKPRIKASFIQKHGREPTGPGAMAERMEHCRWFWDHQETAENKKLINAAYAQYLKDHQWLWELELQAIETPTGDALTAAERQQ